MDWDYCNTYCGLDPSIQRLRRISGCSLYGNLIFWLFPRLNHLRHRHLPRRTIMGLGPRGLPMHRGRCWIPDQPHHRHAHFWGGRLGTTLGIFFNPYRAIFLLPFREVKSHCFKGCAVTKLQAILPTNKTLSNNFGQSEPWDSSITRVDIISRRNFAQGGVLSWIV